MDNSLHNDYKYNSSDEILVYQVQQGDEHSFNVLVERYFSVIRTKVITFTNSDIDDIVQEGLVGLWNAVLTYKPDKNTKFRTYASRCIDNSIISGIKKGKGKKHIPSETLVYLDSDDSKHIEDNENPEKSIIERESYINTIKKIKSLLSKRELKVLSYYLAGNSYCEIAEIMDCDKKSVDNSIQRIRKKLKSKK